MDYGLTLEDVRECMTIKQMTPKGFILIFIEQKKVWIMDIKHSLHKTPTSSPGNLDKVT